MTAPLEVRRLRPGGGPEPQSAPQPWSRLLLDEAPVGLAVVRRDEHLTVETANPAFDRLLGADPLRMATTGARPGPTSTSPAARRCAALGPLFGAAPGGAAVNPTTLRTAHGWVRLHLTRIEADRTRLLVTATDVTELHRALQDAEHRASHDDLTGLPNRSSLARDVAAFVTSAGPVRSAALLYGDIDAFKALNDTHGHVVGDDLLREVATRIAAVLPRSATFARLGGDEFGVFLPDCTPASAAEAVAAVLLALEAPCLARDTLVQMGLSVGLTTFDSRCTESVDTLLHRADTAMYLVKDRRTRSARVDGRR